LDLDGHGEGRKRIVEDLLLEYGVEERKAGRKAATVNRSTGDLTWQKKGTKKKIPQEKESATTGGKKGHAFRKGRSSGKKGGGRLNSDEGLRAGLNLKKKPTAGQNWPVKRTVGGGKFIIKRSAEWRLMGEFEKIAVSQEHGGRGEGEIRSGTGRSARGLGRWVV